jgi:hypothetical protein
VAVAEVEEGRIFRAIFGTRGVTGSWTSGISGTLNFNLGSGASVVPPQIVDDGWEPSADISCSRLYTGGDPFVGVGVRDILNNDLILG